MHESSSACLRMTMLFAIDDSFRELTRTPTAPPLGP